MRGRCSDSVNPCKGPPGLRLASVAVVVRKLLIAGLVALVAAAPAVAQTTTLMPGVTYERAVQFTPHGPVALHVVRAPRPTGLYSLRPVLSNESIQGLERVTTMQKRLTQTATMVTIGLWHGISLNFLIWGIWHGVGLFAHKQWTDRTRKWYRGLTPGRKRTWTFAGWFLTFHYVVLGWVWFALPDVSQSLHVLGGLFGIGL